MAIWIIHTIIMNRFIPSECSATCNEDLPAQSSMAIWNTRNIIMNRYIPSACYATHNDNLPTKFAELFGSHKTWQCTDVFLQNAMHYVMMTYLHKVLGTSCWLLYIKAFYETKRDKVAFVHFDVPCTLCIWWVFPRIIWRSKCAATGLQHSSTTCSISTI